jgi:predicted MFS family arabinose efflux permease
MKQCTSYLVVYILVISGALQPIQDDFIMSTKQKEWIVGATTLGAIFGGFFAGLVWTFYCMRIIYTNAFFFSAI